jgi:hypothetical protein
VTRKLSVSCAFSFKAPLNYKPGLDDRASSSSSEDSGEEVDNDGLRQSYGR